MWAPNPTRLDLQMNITIKLEDGIQPVPGVRQALNTLIDYMNKYQDSNMVGFRNPDYKGAIKRTKVGNLIIYVQKAG